MTKLGPRGPSATVADWLAQPEDARLELIDGELIPKAMPSFEHGLAQGQTIGALGGSFDRRAGGAGGPGGWWLATEVDIYGCAPNRSTRSSSGSACCSATTPTRRCSGGTAGAGRAAVSWCAAGECARGDVR
jgi:hypothetical protein